MYFHCHLGEVWKDILPVLPPRNWVFDVEDWPIEICTELIDDGAGYGGLVKEVVSVDAGDLLVMWRYW